MWSQNLLRFAQFPYWGRRFRAMRIDEKQKNKEQILLQSTLTALFSIPHIFFQCLSAFLFILLSQLLFEFVFLVGVMKEYWSNSNCMFLACRSVAEEKGVVRRLLYSQIVNATSYHMVESSSLLIFFFQLLNVYYKYQVYFMLQFSIWCSFE